MQLSMDYQAAKKPNPADAKSHWVSTEVQFAQTIESLVEDGWELVSRTHDHAKLTYAKLEASVVLDDDDVRADIGYR